MFKPNTCNVYVHHHHHHRYFTGVYKFSTSQADYLYWTEDKVAIDKEVDWSERWTKRCQSLGYDGLVKIRHAHEMAAFTYVII